MGRRLRRSPAFLFLLVCCAAAGLASAQSISVTFLNDWKEQTSRVLGEGRALLRVVDPGADVSPGQDHVSVSVSAAITQDTLTTDLVETGPATGVFEGGVTLTSDYYADNLADSDYLVVSDGLSIPLDTATATYGSASASATAGPSLVDLMDDEGWSPASFALGDTVRVRVRDVYAGRHPGQDTTNAVLSSSGGDSETLALLEAGDHSSVFETSIPLVAGTPVAQDGRLQTGAGETLSVTHADGNPASSSSDSATVVPASVRFIDREGNSTGLYVEEGMVIVRVVDLAANVDPGIFDSAAVTLSRSTDAESLTLRETGPDTGVFEGRMRLLTGTLSIGNGFLEHPNPPATDTVGVAYGSSSDTAQVVRSVTRILNEEGAETASVAPGQTLRLQVDTAYFLSYGELDSVRVRIRSLTTGDEEILSLFETGSDTWRLEATLRPVLGPAIPGDGQIQVQPGEILQAEHLDQNDVPRSSDQVEVVRSALRFVDANGRPVSTLVEFETAHVDVLDLLSAGQAPPAASIESSSSVTGLYASDLELLNLTESGTPGLFAGSMLLTSMWSSEDDGLLYTAWGNNRVTARANGASAVATAAPALLEFLDAQGEPMTTAAGGATLRLRARAPGMNQSSSQDESFWSSLNVLASGDQEWLQLVETGPDTGIFEGTIPTSPSLQGPYILTVWPHDTVTAYFDIFPYGPYGRMVASLPIVPVIVELLDGDGRATSTYLLDETIHLRVSEPAANTSPAGAESITVQVNAWRPTDTGYDLETVTLTETGPDTGVFTGSLASSTLNFYSTATQENGLLEVPEIMPPYREITTVTAARNGVSDRAIVTDSELWLTDDQDQDAASFPIGSSLKVWLRRPHGNTSPGLDTDGVTVRIRPGDADREWVNLTETGGDTGLFTGLLPIVAAPTNTYDGVLGGSPGDLVEAYKSASGYYTLSFDRGVLTAPPNSPPDAVDDPSGADEDVPVTIQVRANDTDPENDPLTIIAVTQGTKGSVTINNGSTVTYAPNLNANGTDSFTYTISDGNGGTDTATVTISITPMNDPPVAGDDAATTEEDAPVTITVLSNDTDVESDTLTVTSVTQGAKGSVTVNADNTVTFTPWPGFDGAASFSYTAFSPSGYDFGAVAITVTGQNDPPVVANDTGENGEDAPIVVSVLENDKDPEDQALTVTAVTQGANGTVAITGGGTQVTYTPAPNFHGSDSFTYTAADPQGLSTVGTVAVTVTPMNDPPVAVDDTATTPEDTTVTIAVLGNDTDVDGDTLAVASVTQSTAGTVTTNGTTVTFTPPANQSGTWFFTYTARDTAGSLDTASVAVTVTAVNDPPVAAPDAGATNEDTPIVIAVLANDTDVDSGSLSVSAVTQGAHGTVTSNGTSVTYTPAANWNGADAFTYTVSDGQGGTATAAVSVSVAAVNDPPVAAPDSSSTRENISIILSVLANDTDIDVNPLTVPSVGLPAHGTASRLPDNTVTYTPVSNFTGTDSFSYTVSDGQGGTATGQVTVVIGEALERVAILATNSVALRTGSDVLSGDVITNQAGAGPFLNGAELSVGGGVTAASNYDLEGDSVTVASGAVVGSDVRYNQLTNNGTINGQQSSPLPMPVFSALPPFLTATPGTTTINVSMNGSQTLAAGSYLDLIVARKGTVTFTGGTYHFRTIQIDREAKLYFSAASEIRVQQKLSTKTLTTIGPAAGATIDASSILFYVAGINGTAGTLAATPKAVEIGTNNVLNANFYTPNGTTWLQDTTQATGAFLGKDIDVGINVQVQLDSAFSGGQ